MSLNRHHAILLEVVGLPTAPFAEGAVLDYVRRFLAGRKHVSLAADRWGNLLARYRRAGRPGGKSAGKADAKSSASGRRPGPLWLAAHSDHPGFVAERMTGKHRLRAHWFGAVGLEYFKTADLRFYVPADQSDRNRDPANSTSGAVRKVVTGRITSVVTSGKFRTVFSHVQKRPTAVYVEVDEPVAPGSPGVWALPRPRIAGSRVLAGGHDDLAQVAALLCLLDELDRREVAGDVTCVFTRAEEAGFVGAIGLATGGVVPADAAFISLEASSAQAAGVKLGDGPILRVGDLASTFDQATLAWMGRVGRDLAAADPGFRFQRKLMPGGTCEATPLAVFGYATGAMCLPLGNYHNMGPGKRIAPEAIDLRDFDRQIAWLVELVVRADQRGRVNQEMAARLRQRFADHRRFLTQWMKL